MIQLESALELATKRRASDVHFSVGRPIMIRVDGTLLQLNDDVLKPADIKDAFTPILTDSQREKVETLGEVDFAYSLKGVGRFRLNVFKQRGTYAASLRLLPFQIPTPESLGIPEAVIATTTKKRGLVLVTGPTGSGKSNACISS